MPKGAIEIAIENRAARVRQTQAAAREREALADLKSLGVESSADTLDQGFVDFALLVKNSPDVRSALQSAKDSGIRVVITNRESHVVGEDIYVCFGDTPPDIYAFLMGKP